MRQRVRVGLGGAVVAGLPVATAAASPASRPLSKLRVCGTNQVPFRGAQCPRDESRAPITASELDCSVHETVRHTETFRAEFRYLGRLQYQYTERLKPGSGTRFIGVYFYDTPMPAGGYSCRFTLGARSVARSFHSDGPAGNLLGPSICLGSHHVGQDECRRDEGNAPLPATSQVTCDTVFARELGRTATVALLDAAGLVIDSRKESLGHPITEAGATFTSPVVFPPGSYDCRFAVAGQHVDRDFDISG